MPGSRRAPSSIHHQPSLDYTSGPCANIDELRSNLNSMSALSSLARTLSPARAATTVPLLITPSELVKLPKVSLPHLNRVKRLVPNIQVIGNNQAPRCIMAHAQLSTQADRRIPCRSSYPRRNPLGPRQDCEPKDRCWGFVFWFTSRAQGMGGERTGEE